MLPQTTNKLTTRIMLIYKIGITAVQKQKQVKMHYNYKSFRVSLQKNITNDQSAYAQNISQIETVSGTNVQLL